MGHGTRSDDRKQRPKTPMPPSIGAAYGRYLICDARWTTSRQQADRAPRPQVASPGRTVQIVHTLITAAPPAPRGAVSGAAASARTGRAASGRSPRGARPAEPRRSAPTVTLTVTWVKRSLIHSDAERTISRERRRCQSRSFLHERSSSRPWRRQSSRQLLRQFSPSAGTRFARRPATSYLRRPPDPKNSQSPLSLHYLARRSHLTTYLDPIWSRQLRPRSGPGPRYRSHRRDVLLRRHCCHFHIRSAGYCIHRDGS
jgi:hypothetical protein